MEDINLLIKEIKQSFRQMMDGTIAQSMRDKGVNYHLNWGATIPRLKDKAAADSTGVKWLKVIQQATYPLWIAGTQVTEVNASNITGTGITVSGSTEEGDGISFSNTDNQLTLKNVTIDYSNSGSTCRLLLRRLFSGLLLRESTTNCVAFMCCRV